MKLRGVKKHLWMTATILMAIGLARPAYAYIDPGSGSLILQVLLAIGAGVLIQFRQTLAMVLKWFSRVIGGIKRPRHGD